jgi:hypothetical protein
MFREETSAFFEQFKIMMASIGKGRGKDTLHLLVNNHLRFLGVTLLFAIVVLASFFRPFNRLFGDINEPHFDQSIARLQCLPAGQIRFS